MTGAELLARLQAEAGDSGFHRGIEAWVDDRSGVARALRLLDEEGA